MNVTIPKFPFNKKRCYFPKAKNVIEVPRNKRSITSLVPNTVYNIDERKHSSFSFLSGDNCSKCKGHGAHESRAQHSGVCSSESSDEVNFSSRAQHLYIILFMCLCFSTPSSSTWCTLSKRDTNSTWFSSIFPVVSSSCNLNAKASLWRTLHR